MENKSSGFPGNMAGHKRRWASPTLYTFSGSPGSQPKKLVPDDGCEVVKGCYRNPSDCKPGTAGCLFASWKHV